MFRPRRGQAGAAGVSRQVRAKEGGAQGVSSGLEHGDRGVEWAQEREVEEMIAFFRRAARDRLRDTCTPGAARGGHPLGQTPPSG